MELVWTFTFLKMNNPWHLYLMAGMYVVAGFIHFVKPKVYIRVMPKYLPNPKALVYLSGISEIVLGLGLCFKLTKDISILGIIAMLAAFLTVHFYMLSNKKAAAGIPIWILILRIPLQFGLMYWAYAYLAL